MSADLSKGMYMQDSATAKALAFHKEVRTRCVTLDGDDFNPGGLLTGKQPPEAHCLMTVACGNTDSTSMVPDWLNAEPGPCYALTPALAGLWTPMVNTCLQVLVSRQEDCAHDNLSDNDLVGHEASQQSS